MTRVKLNKYKRKIFLIYEQLRVNLSITGMQLKKNVCTTKNLNILINYIKLLHQSSYSGLKIVIMLKITKFSAIKYHRYEF